ncbi:phytoene desaturase [Rhodococcus sp. BP-349]|uniref:phytoene desaturase family protein n=1 Tax=unclassified Rhodococcus (in: high G+C Gram-positive bacteria) TaxID=192944 RepID=UPI001C9A9819|nr:MULTISPECIES: phytoene desaturase family protein [unclassified Rhodococcus (in: high G+C Gram-positive bacteria)]MBY6540727.1 phytoene desaturase [Rhodococcus sp. BP-363]MBY6545247.1 phytoene desaturase [Rhodococcus sp. BP-369]MBY6564477.1 phytoene desaturase [Rhodococcus sp. BP-370]MBY6578586.1 phytoene desaturase [Rhodococcus sp. BP-364]MBY6587887.1 phytoene desaturase [Rhodococcus sp. BP-358]
MTHATVSGPTDHVIVVGAGLSGLAAALHLRGTGREVTVIERSDTVGGRVGSVAAPGYRIDTGASVLTMPDLIDQALAAVGATRESTTPPLRLTPLHPAYHTRFADGTTIDVHSDPERMIAEVGEKCGLDEARRYRTLRAWIGSMFDAEFDRYIDDNFDSPLDLVGERTARANTLTLLRLGGFGKLGKRIDKLIDDPRLRRIFTFQALYAGVAPAKALGVYSAISHMDTSLGVSFPDGGMQSIANAMADAFVSAGGTLLLSTGVAAIEKGGSRARAVVTENGERHACDSLILTPDLLVTDRLLATAGITVRRKVRASPSCVVVHGRVPVDVTARWSSRSHHVIDFGHNWNETFEELTASRGRGTLMSDPSLLITRTSLTDPALRVTHDGVEQEPISILAPCPNLDSAPLDWSAITDPYVREILLEMDRRGYTGVSEHLEIDHIDTPATWLAQGMVAGTPFSASHIFRQTGPFRRRNLVKGIDNVVLAGCGTTPGVGVPTVLISGRLAAERIDPSVRRSARVAV